MPLRPDQNPLIVEGTGEAARPSSSPSPPLSPLCTWGGGGGEIRTPPPRARRAASVENRLAPTEEREGREREVAAVTLPGKV